MPLPYGLDDCGFVVESEVRQVDSSSSFFFLKITLAILGFLYFYTNYSAIKKNSFESVLMRWMKLEPIIQSEVSQKDKDQYSILTHIYRI